MPNHCYNVLSLTDNPSETYNALKKFIKKEKDTKREFLDFNKIIKMPKDLQVDSVSNPSPALAKKYKENIEKYGCKSWYEWSNANWGTKWNSYDFQAQDECVSFSTAWAPPEPVIIELANKTKQNWTLRFTEEGMSFCGELQANKDGVVKQNSWDLRDAPEEFRDEMGISDEDIYSEEELRKMRRSKIKENLKKKLKDLPPDISDI